MSEKSGAEKFVPRKWIRKMDLEFLEEMTTKQQMFVITDPSQKDHPIVFASERFVEFTKYAASEIKGRNCRFLQGVETDSKDALEIRNALKEMRDCNLGIINYKQNGEKFYNQFYMTTLRGRPWIFNRSGKVKYFIGIQFQADEDNYKDLNSSLVKNYGKAFRDKQKMTVANQWDGASPRAVY